MDEYLCKPIAASDQYLALTQTFGKLWLALGWKVSTWVHWVVRHSHALGMLHRNFYLFSSIPNERRNVEFKLDVTHCSRAGNFPSPTPLARALPLFLTSPPWMSVFCCMMHENVAKNDRPCKLIKNNSASLCPCLAEVIPWDNVIEM